MIVVRLMGGLGNQMFQHAAARALAASRGAEVAFDLFRLAERSPTGVSRAYELGVFNVAARPATRREVAELYGHGRNAAGTAWLRARGAMGLARRSPRVFQERGRGYDPSLANVPDDAYLIGFFQSERYFAGVAGLIREEFTFRRPAEGRNLELAGALAEVESVALHVRRADYDTPAGRSAHGLLDEDYYARAAAYVAERAPRAHGFVFSDEPARARRLRLPIPFTVVDHNPPAAGAEDMRLMSLCRHNVIANSSFSWWAAWLNGNPGKIVVAPKAWFARPDLETPDRVPGSWLRM